MYSELSDIWSGEIPERREKPESGSGARNLADVDVVRHRNERLYAVVGALPRLTGGLVVKLPTKVFSDTTVSLLMDCLSA